VIVYTAIRKIEVGEELCINYGMLWFEDADGDISGEGDENGDGGFEMGVGNGSHGEDEGGLRNGFGELGAIELDSI
jgi:hypothetical protein